MTLVQDIVSDEHARRRVLHAFKQRLKDAIRALPDNEKFAERITGNCVMINLRYVGNWSPENHIFSAQKDMLIDLIDSKNSAYDIVKKLRGILKTGKIKLCGGREVKLHEELLSALKDALRA